MSSGFGVLRRGVTSIRKFAGTVLTGDVTLSAGANVTITQVGQDIAIAATGLGGGAPTDADYLVGTANATLTNEIVVGTTPGGELGGSWASPTVDATHSGSAHHAQAHALDDSANHSATTDIATLNSSTTAHGLLRKLDGLTTTFLRGDGAWAAPTASAADPSYSPGSFTVATETCHVQANHLKFTTTQRLTLAGTGRLSLIN